MIIMDAHVCRSLIPSSLNEKFELICLWLKRTARYRPPSMIGNWKIYGGFRTGGPERNSPERQVSKSGRTCCLSLDKTSGIVESHSVLYFTRSHINRSCHSRFSLYTILHVYSLKVTSSRFRERGGAWIDEGLPKREKLLRETRGVENQMKNSQSELAKPRHVLEQLDWLMKPVTPYLDELQGRRRELG